MATKRDIKELNELINNMEKNRRQDIKQLQAKIEDIVEEVKTTQSTADTALKRSQNNEVELKHLRKRLAELSDRQRRRNLRIIGITEQIKPRDLEKTLIDFFQKHGIAISEQDIERAHRSLKPKPKPGQKPRDIVIAFSRGKVQNQVWRNLRKQKDLQFQGERVFPRLDLSPETLEERKKMKPYAQKLHENRILFSWGLPATILIFKNGKLLRASNPEEAEKLLHKLNITMEVKRQEERQEEEEEGEEGEEEEEGDQ